METFDRNNRNRRGGHKTLMPVNHRFGNECMYCTPVEKKLIKRLSKKKIRRQWQATQAEVQREMNNDWTWQDQWQELMEYESLQEEYDDEPMDYLCSAYDDDRVPDWYEEQGYSTEEFFGYTE